jgi:hypothetical protein
MPPRGRRTTRAKKVVKETKETVLDLSSSDNTLAPGLGLSHVPSQPKLVRSRTSSLTTPPEIPADETLLSTDETQNPAAETLLSTDETQNPAAETLLSTAETQNPVAETQNPVDETQNPVAETQNPVDETQKPVAATLLFADETQNPVAETLLFAAETAPLPNPPPVPEPHPVHPSIVERKDEPPVYEPYIVPEQPKTDDTKDLVNHYEDKLKRMEDLIQNQQHLMMKLIHQQAQTEGQEEEKEPTPLESQPQPSELASWPQPIASETTSNATDEEYVTRSRLETIGRSFEEVYANENMDVSKNITFTDASAGTWGSMSQVQTNVGMRTRGLFLNPTLQQPSIGGLM